MEVLRLHGLRDLRLHDEPIPEPGPGESRVRITSVGVCGSDLHWFSEAGIGDAKITVPLVLGHEFAGVVADPHSPLHGRPVAVDPAIPCLECEFCLEGNPNFCSNLRFAGHGEEDGGLSEYVVWPDRCLFPLPENLNGDSGAMLEPLGIALHAVDLGHIRPGLGVGVFGCGPIGLLILQELAWRAPLRSLPPTGSPTGWRLPFPTARRPPSCRMKAGKIRPFGRRRAGGESRSPSKLQGRTRPSKQPSKLPAREGG